MLKSLKTLRKRQSLTDFPLQVFVDVSHQPEDVTDHGNLGFREARLLVGEKIDFNTVLPIAQRLDVRGYAVQLHDKILLLLESNPGKLFHLRAQVKDLVEHALPPGGHFPDLPPLMALDVSQWVTTVRGNIDGVSPLGELTGWAFAPGKYVEAQVWVDNEEAGSLTANRFRKDLLQAGIGLGAHSFRWRLPDRFLDGREHRLRIAFEGTVLEKTAVCPMYLHIERTWLGQPPRLAVLWSDDDEASFLQARDEVIYGDYPKGCRLAATLIERRPSAVFRDFGIQERYLVEKERAPSFRDRLDARWAQLFDNQPCELGSKCCKTTPLSYNAPQPARTAAWSSNDLFKVCPRPIRHLASKEQTKRYASLVGVRVARHFFDITSVEELVRLDELQGRYVLKPDFESGRGIFLMQGDINLFNRRRYRREDLRAEISKYFDAQPKARFGVEELLVQEGVPTDGLIIPLDYKFHCFGGKALLVQIDDRNTISRDPLNRRQAWYSRDWLEAPFRMRITEQQSEPIRPPECLPEMLDIVDRIAKDLHDYIRVDMYATAEGPVLGELTSFSHSGIGFTDFGSTILSQTWEIYSSDQSG